MTVIEEGNFENYMPSLSQCAPYFKKMRKTIEERCIFSDELDVHHLLNSTNHQPIFSSWDDGDKKVFQESIHVVERPKFITPTFKKRDLENKQINDEENEENEDSEDDSSDYVTEDEEEEGEREKEKVDQKEAGIENLSHSIQNLGLKVEAKKKRTIKEFLETLETLILISDSS